MNSFLAVFIITFLSSSLLHAQTQVTINFSEPAYYPLLKGKTGVHNRAMGSANNLPNWLGPAADLQLGTYRVLASQQGNNLIFKDGDNVAVTKPDNYATLFSETHAQKILPMVTLYKTPIDFRESEDVDDNVPPFDLEGYGAGVQLFVDQFQDVKPISWEVWNEPESDTYLTSNDNVGDYNKIYETVAPKIRVADPDALIAGPAMFNNANHREDFNEEFVANVLSKDLPLDFYSIHSYNRFRSNVDDLPVFVGIVRNEMGANFQTVPIIFTEYEFYPAGDTENIIEKQKNRELTQGAVNWLFDMNYFIEQTDIMTVTWNRWRAIEGDRGGLIFEDLSRRPIYWTNKLYGDMPVERKAMTFTNADKLNGFASANESRAGILIWNEKSSAQSVTISTANLPFANGTVSLYRIDADNSSYLENSATDELSLISTTDISTLDNLSLDIPGPGIIFLDIIPEATPTETEELGATFIRSWQWTGRNGDGSITGDYGDFDWRNWTARSGVKGETGRGISGVTIENTPSAFKVSTEAFNLDPQSDNNALLGIRLDYVAGGNPTKSVLFHGGIFNAARTNELPWGAGGVTADVIIDKSSIIGNSNPFRINIDSLAPDGWSGGERRAIISLWMENTGVESQAVMKMFDPEVSSSDTQVFYYPFDGSLADQSENNVVLSNPHAETFYSVDSVGVHGQALALSGASGTYLQIEQTGLLDPATTDYTVCAWVKNKSDVDHPNEHVILHQTGDGTGATRYLLAAVGTDQLNVGSFVGGGASQSTGVIPRNVWTHIAIVGTHENSTLQFYINGEKDSEVITDAFETSTHGFFLGKHRANGKADATWVGLIDELYLFNTALTEEQIAELMGTEGGSNEPTLFTFRLDENPTPGTVVGTVTSSLEGSSMYSIISGNELNAFQLDANSGEISIADAAVIDYETISTFELSVEISNGNLTETAIVTILLSDVNEAPSIEEATFTVDENAPTSTLVGAVSSSDPESDDLTFSIISGNDLGGFQIDQNTGEITVDDPSPLDFETNPTFELSVGVSDGELSDEALINIHLNDEEEAVLGTRDKQGNMVNLFPNPTDDFVTIKWSSFKKCTVSELSGKLLFMSDTPTLSLKGLGPGVYLIAAYSTNNEQVIFRVKKE